MDSTVAAYFAGVADSDGSFCFAKQYSRKTKSGYDQFRPCFQLSWIDTEETRETLEELRLRFGGCVNTVKRRGGFQSNRKIVLKYYLQGKCLVSFCDAIIPFLRLKKQKALLIRDYYQLVLGKHWNQHNPKPPAINERAKELHALFYKLNTKNGNGAV